MARTHDLMVIDAGAARLTAAGGHARLGVRVALVERERMWGECLDTGCVPLKALLAAAQRAPAVRGAGRLRILAPEPPFPGRHFEPIAFWGSVQRLGRSTPAPHQLAGIERAPFSQT